MIDEFIVGICDCFKVNTWEGKWVGESDCLTVGTITDLTEGEIEGFWFETKNGSGVGIDTPEIFWVDGFKVEETDNFKVERNCGAAELDRIEVEMLDGRIVGEFEL